MLFAFVSVYALIRRHVVARLRIQWVKELFGTHRNISTHKMPAHIWPARRRRKKNKRNEVKSRESVMCNTSKRNIIFLVRTSFVSHRKIFSFVSFFACHVFVFRECVCSTNGVRATGEVVREFCAMLIPFYRCQTSHHARVYVYSIFMYYLKEALARLHSLLTALLLLHIFFCSRFHTFSFSSFFPYFVVFFLQGNSNCS